MQMTVREALNSALDEEMSADHRVFLMGEEVMKLKVADLNSLFCSFRWSFTLSCADFRYTYVQVGEYQGAYKVINGFTVFDDISMQSVDLIKLII